MNNSVQHTIQQIVNRQNFKVDLDYHSYLMLNDIESFLKEHLSKWEQWRILITNDNELTLFYQNIRTGSEVEKIIIKGN